MTDEERLKMTTLEQAVWAAAYIQAVALFDDGVVSNDDALSSSVTTADRHISDLRRVLEQRRISEQTYALDQRHKIRATAVDGRFGVMHGWQCACGYTPPAGKDPDEMMALHIAHVGATMPPALAGKAP